MHRFFNWWQKVYTALVVIQSIMAELKPLKKKLDSSQPFCHNLGIWRGRR